MHSANEDTTDFNPEGSGQSSVQQGSLNPGCTSRLVVFWKCKHCWALLWIPPSLPMDWRFLSCRELSAKSVQSVRLSIFSGIGDFLRRLLSSIPIERSMTRQNADRRSANAQSVITDNGVAKSRLGKSRRARSKRAWLLLMNYVQARENSLLH